MSSIFKNSIFWKRFVRFLIFGLSIFVILASFKAGENTQVAADYTCPTATGMASFISPVNNQSLPTGTTSVIVSWNSAPYAQTYSVTATNLTSGSVVYANADLPGTSFTLTPLVNGNSYRILIQPKNNCGQGSSSEISFSVASTQTSCTNQPIFCPDVNEGGGSYMYPDPNNNCIIPSCDGGTSGQLTCSITQQFQGGNNYGLAANPSNLPYGNYNWDLDGNNVFNDGQGPNIPSRSFSPNTTVKLQVRDVANNIGVCSTFIGNSGSNVATCTINPQSTTISQGGYVSFSGSYNPNMSNRYATNYHWNFGDGSTYSGGTNNQASHNFSNSNTVTLTVNDNVGSTTSCSAYVTVSNPGNVCSTDAFTCPNGNVVYRNPSLNCQFNSCPGQGSQCRSMSCPGAPAGCSYSGQLTYSCDPNATLTCGTLTGNCSSIGTSTIFNPGSGTTIVNNNSSSSSSSSSNNNNNNININ